MNGSIDMIKASLRCRPLTFKANSSFEIEFKLPEGVGVSEAMVYLNHGSSPLLNGKLTSSFGCEFHPSVSDSFGLRDLLQDEPFLYPHEVGDRSAAGEGVLNVVLWIRPAGQMVWLKFTGRFKLQVATPHIQQIINQNNTTINANETYGSDFHVNNSRTEPDKGKQPELDRSVSIVEIEAKLTRDAAYSGDRPQPICTTKNEPRLHAPLPVKVNDHGTSIESAPVPSSRVRGEVRKTGTLVLGQSWLAVGVAVFVLGIVVIAFRLNLISIIVNTTLQQPAPSQALGPTLEPIASPDAENLKALETLNNLKIYLAQIVASEVADSNTLLCDALNDSHKRFITARVDEWISTNAPELAEHHRAGMLLEFASGDGHLQRVADWLGGLGLTGEHDGMVIAVTRSDLTFREPVSAGGRGEIYVAVSSSVFEKLVQTGGVDNVLTRHLERTLSEKLCGDIADCGLVVPNFTLSKRMANVTQN